MDLTKFLKRMEKNPERFSNLAFWREVRKLKTNIVATFKYVESWGTHIESLLPNGYVESSEIELTPNIEFDPKNLDFRIFTLSRQSDGVLTILPILSVIGDHFKINFTTEKTSILIGKHIDDIRVDYLTSDNKQTVNFEMPTPKFKQVWFNNGFVNGCSIGPCSVLSNYIEINENDLASFQNMELNRIRVYYH